MSRPVSAHGANLAQDHRITSAPHVPPLTIPPLSVRSPLHGTAPDLSHARSNTTTPPGNHLSSPRTYSTPASSIYGTSSHVNRSNSDGQYYRESSARSYDSSSAVRSLPIATYDTTQRNANFGSSNPAQYQKPLDTSPHNARSSGDTSTSPADFRAIHSSAYINHSNSSQSYAGQAPSRNGNINHGSYLTHQQFPPLQTLPPPIFPMTPQTLPRASEVSYSPAAHSTHPSADSASDMDMSTSGAADVNLMDPMAAADSMPVFGAEGYNGSPSIHPDNLVAWLLNDPNTISPGGHQRGPLSIGSTAFMDNSGHISALAYSMGGSSLGGHYDSPIPQQQPIMAVTSILDSGLPQMILSEEKRQQLLEVIVVRFNETDHAPVRRQKEALFEGDQEQDSHVLSLQMLQTYIKSYWYHFHPQMPILHKSTFSADHAQNLLLIAVIAIGASCLDKMHGPSITKAGAELSCFLAWHLRGEIFMDADFRPPAKLWVFQTLILLEIYEKMYATRVLHERAHIHHATTLTLMRRGSSLMGKSALDSPPSLNEGKPGPATNGFHRAAAAFAFSPDQWWNHWITSEATRRVAFAAFIVDALHATMFGHGASMNAFEMRLTLPVDEALWSATSGGEVGKLEANLSASGITPTPFLEALKRTLDRESVRTNSFGRTALMAGLLNLTWHMKQRDLQVYSLGVPRLGGKDIWRGPLTKAFDHWKRDFDESVANEDAAMSTPYSRSDKLDEENIFESRTVLHHLAHMAKHVDIVQLQIFARARRLLGRTITPQDYINAQKRIKDKWARSAAARDATFYALKFLCQVLLPDADNLQHSPNAARTAIFSGYSARDDFLLNRPWVLYFAALTVWSYGFALDGPIRSPPVLRTFEDQSHDMGMFLQHVGSVERPDGLMNMHDRNACMGMLLILRDMFRDCRWELLHEAANLLSNCIQLLKGLV